MSTELQKAYALLEASCKLKEGDTVKVLRKAEAGEMGWGTSWVPSMDTLVGKEAVIIKSGYSHSAYQNGKGKGFALKTEDGNICLYPFFVLEKVKDGKPPFKEIAVKLNSNHTAKITTSCVEVGCQRFEFSAIKELALAVKSAQEYNRS